MSSGILGALYQENLHQQKISQNPLEVWHDLWSYARNFDGNWMVSQEIFNTKLAPAALNSPEYFADCVEEMVKASGAKVKNQSRFSRALKKLKNLKNKKFDAIAARKALTDILNAGLKEPFIAEKALKSVQIGAFA